MNVSQDSTESTLSTRAVTNKTDNTDPRNLSMNGDGCADGQGIEHGCPARIGATVLDGEGPEGVITGLTKHLVIFEDKNGHECAQRYGHCTAPLAPPANFTGPVGVVTEPQPPNIPADVLAQCHDGRYRRLQIKALELMLEVEAARNESIERLVDDHDMLIQALEDFQLKASEIDDNRLAAVMWQARHAVSTRLSADTEGDAA